MPDLVAGALRRQRLIERTGDEVWAMFRDTYARPDGTTSVLHEYTVKALVSDHSSDDIFSGGGGRWVGGRGQRRSRAVGSWPAWPRPGCCPGPSARRPPPAPGAWSVNGWAISGLW